jgi:Methyltransferase domain
LIINSNVLEHVGFPVDLVKQILHAAPEGGLVFLEVPCEIPMGFTRIARRLAQMGVMTLFHPSLAQYVVRPATFYMMHEHVNYFTEQSLAKLMRARGGRVFASGSYSSSD